MSGMLTWSGGKAAVQGIGVEDLAAKYGTPIYLYDRNVFTAQFANLRQALPSAIEIYYSIKANPHPSVINVFVQHGAGCEIASGGDNSLIGRTHCLKRKDSACSKSKLWEGLAAGKRR